MVCLVPDGVAWRVTPRKSRWLERVKKGRGIMAWVMVFLNLPSGRNLHFYDSAVRCILHPEAISKMVITLSTRMNSHLLVIDGFRSSQ